MLPTSHSLSPALRNELLSLLLRLPFTAFIQSCADLLTALGYEDVRPVARGGKNGKNRSGGIDLEGWVRVGATRRPIVAQVKQIDLQERVPRRYLDEVRGAALRIGATEALLLTTGTFSYLVLEQIERQQRALASNVPPMVPVQCVDGEKLAGLLIQHKIGILREENIERVDYAYFSRLSERYCAKRPGENCRPGPVSAKQPSHSVKAAADRAVQPAKPQMLPGTQLSIHLWIPERTDRKRMK